MPWRGHKTEGCGRCCMVCRRVFPSQMILFMKWKILEINHVYILKDSLGFIYVFVYSIKGLEHGREVSMCKIWGPCYQMLRHRLDWHSVLLLQRESHGREVIYGQCVENDLLQAMSYSRTCLTSVHAPSDLSGRRSFITGYTVAKLRQKEQGHRKWRVSMLDHKRKSTAACKVNFKAPRQTYFPRPACSRAQGRWVEAGPG